MTWHELLQVRITCRSFFNLVQAHASDLTRNMVKHYKSLARGHSLYKDVYDSSNPTLDYVIDLSHRCYVVEALARFLAKYRLMELFGQGVATRLKHTYHAPFVDRVINNLKPHLIIISHMLETYRSSMAELVQDIDPYDMISLLWITRNSKLNAWRPRY